MRCRSRTDDWIKKLKTVREKESMSKSLNKARVAVDYLNAMRQNDLIKSTGKKYWILTKNALKLRFS